MDSTNHNIFLDLVLSKWKEDEKLDQMMTAQRHIAHLSIPRESNLKKKTLMHLNNENLSYLPWRIQPNKCQADLTIWTKCWIIQIFAKAQLQLLPLNRRKHCQRHNGPEGWVHITSSYTNLDQISSISIKLKLETLTKPSSRISSKILTNLAWTSTSKYWPNLVPKVWTKA